MDFKISELFAKLRPFILDLISLAGGGSGPFAPSPHDLSGAHHSGSIADSQATQFLKTDGSRGLTGNLAVTDGITIDGVDLSALASTVSGHTGATAAAGHGSVGAHDHQSAGNGGQLDHGAALSGLGDDDHTQYLNTLRHDMTTRHPLGAVVPHDDHGALSGLGDDDHSQYLLVNGTRDMAGNLTPAATDTYDIGSSVKLWRKGYLSELDALVFAEQTITLVGGWLMICKDQGSLAADVASASSYMDFGKTMTIGDIVLLRSKGQVEYVKILSLFFGTLYRVTRNLDGSGANDWVKGTPFAVLGYNGTGRIELNAYDTPRLSVIKQGTTYSAQTELIRLGDLNGNWGYTSEKYGLAIGKYASGKPNIVVDEDGNLKFRIYSTDVMTFAAGNADITGKLRMPGASSAIAIGATPPTSASAGTGLWLDRNGFYGLASSVVQVSIDAATGMLKAGAGDVEVGSGGITLNSKAYAQSAAIQFESYLMDDLVAEIWSKYLSAQAERSLNLQVRETEGSGGAVKSWLQLNYGTIGVEGALKGIAAITADETLVSGGLVVGSVNPAKATDAKTIALVQQDTDPTNASGYGKVWYGGGKDWLWGKNDSSNYRYPLGVAELNFPLNSFYLSTGAAFSTAVTGNPQITFRDAQVDAIDTEFAVPYGWAGRIIKVTFWWWSAAAGNVYWHAQLRKIVDGGGLLSSGSDTTNVLASSSNLIVKSSMTFNYTTVLVDGEAVKFRIYRYGTHASDVRTGDAYLLAVKVSVVD